MKTTLTILLGLLSVTGLWAQGRINFNNSSATPLRISDWEVTQVLGTASTAHFGFGPASVRVRLFAGLTPDNLQPMLIGTAGNLPFVTNYAGTIASAQGTFPGGSNLVLPFDGTQPVYLQFTAEQIDGWAYAVSPVIQVYPTISPAPPTAVFSAAGLPNTWNGLTLFGSPYPPPVIHQHPQSQVAAVGDDVTLTVSASAATVLTYQWRKNGSPLSGQTLTNLALTDIALADAGNYDVVVATLFHARTSQVATVTVHLPVLITQHPATQVVPLHGTAVFDSLADAVPAPNYQWLFNGAVLSGATSASLVLTNVGTNLLGDYSVTAWNQYSAATSLVATLLMSPSLRTPFVGVTAIWGKEATLSVSAVGSGELSYQWFKDGELVPDGTNATLHFPAVQISDGGFYSVVVTSALGSVTNTPAQLVINPANISLGFYAGITIDGVPGYTYTIEYSTNLADVNGWHFITNVTLVEPVELWLDPSVESRAPGNNGRHYRVTAPEPEP